MLKNQNGFGLLLVLLVIVQIPIILSVSTSMLQRKSGITAKVWDEFSLQESTRSSFILMESALRRRLWEPPPDENCIRQKDFYIESKSSNGFTFKVIGKYIPSERIIELTAIGSIGNLKTEYKKYHKMIDVADYLYLSRDPNDEVVLSKAAGDFNTPISLIAGPRRIQIAGRLKMMSDALPSKSDLAWNLESPKNLPFPRGVGTVIQGDRIEIGKGLHYATNIMSINKVKNLPDANYQKLKNDLEKYTNSLFFAQRAGSLSMITKDYNLAIDHIESVLSGKEHGSAIKSKIEKQIYPLALFGGDKGKFPLLASEASASDNTYLNKIENTYLYSHYETPFTWSQENFSCLTKDPVNKSCSASWLYPNSFDQWRKDADLEFTLKTNNEAKQISLNEIDWDTMEALEEDAEQCGLVVTENTKTDAEFSDCDISDYNFLKTYVSNNGKVNCPKLKSLDLEKLEFKLKNLSPASLSQNSTEDASFQRRVIYSKVPLELVQSHKNGLWPDLTNKKARDRFSLVIVNESKTILRPYQDDLTSPLDIHPEKMRSTYFNTNSQERSSTSTAKMPSLKIAILSPEDVQVVTPQYIYNDILAINKMLPVISGKIQPVRHLITDFVSQENDGFKFGVRNIFIENIALLTSIKNQADPEYLRLSSRPNGLALRGLWSALGNSHDYVWNNACMFAQPDKDSLDIMSATRGWWPHQTPLQVAEDLSTAKNSSLVVLNPKTIKDTDVLPPIGSNFYQYNSKTKMRDLVPSDFAPAVFQIQKNHGLTSSSAIFFSGSMIRVGFSNTKHSTRNIKLSDKKFTFISTVSDSELRTANVGEYFLDLDLSRRKVIWNEPNMFEKKSNFSCEPGGLVRLVSLSNMLVSIRVNGGYMTFSQLPLNEDFFNLASLNNLELPTLLMTGR